MAKAKTDGVRVAVIDRGFISPYFDAFFSVLNRSENRQYVVFYGDPPRNTGLQAAPPPYSFPTVRIRNVELYKTAVYQTLVKEVTSGAYDAVIMGHELKFLSNWLVVAICKLKGIPVILWGFGYHAPRGVGYRLKGSPLWSRLASTLKDWIARAADGYLAYTNRGAERMRHLRLKCRIFVVRPSVNVAEQLPLYERFRNEDRASLRKRLGLRANSIVFLYLGRLVEAKNPAGLLELAARLNADQTIETPIEVRIIGGGEHLDVLRQRSEGMEEAGVLGEIYDQETIAAYLAASDAVVLPGAAGITVTHAFAHGVPVLMRQSPLHSPEADYVVDGKNGLISGADFEDLIACAKQFVLSPELRERLSDGALQTRQDFGFERMADQFDAAVDAVFSNPPGRKAVGTSRRAA